MITVRYKPIRNKRQWQAVAVVLRDATEPLTIGFVRFTVAGGCWVARTRLRDAFDNVKVKSFADRRDAATWLLVGLGYAVRPAALALAA